MQRFKKILDRFKFKTTPVFNRPDLLSVRYHNHHIFTIPKKIFDRPIAEYRDENLDMAVPHFFELEQKAMYWNWVVRNTPYCSEKEQLEREQENEN